MDRETEASPPSSGMLFVDWSPGDHGHGTIEIMVTAWWQLLIDIMVTAWWQLTIQIMDTAWWQLAIEIMVRPLTTEIMVSAAARRRRKLASVAKWLKRGHPSPTTHYFLQMTYRHHSLRCHHLVQDTQGSNQHQLRITCQQCQGHLAIVYGRHLNAETRRQLLEYLNTTPVPVHRWRPPSTEPEQHPQPRARAAAAMNEPQDEPEPAVRVNLFSDAAWPARENHEEPQEDVEVHRARLNRTIGELNQEIQRLMVELEGLPGHAPPPTPAPPPPPAENPPEENPRQREQRE